MMENQFCHRQLTRGGVHNQRRYQRVNSTNLQVWCHGGKCYPLDLSGIILPLHVITMILILLFWYCSVVLFFSFSTWLALCRSEQDLFS